MDRPKKEIYFCVNAGCIGDNKCQACRFTELWRYVEYLEKKLKIGKVIKKVGPLTEGSCRGTKVFKDKSNKKPIYPPPPAPPPKRIISEDVKF